MNREKIPQLHLRYLRNNMAQTFEDITRDTVDRFLHNVLFVDDNAYSEKRENAFDAKEISSVFAQKGKLCTIFAPSTEGELQNCSSLFEKSDVVVLDWYLNLENNQQNADVEADAETEEPRGIYTIELIKHIVNDALDKKLKLVVVYTGDGAKLYDITRDIHDAIATDANFNIDENNCQVFSTNVSILVRAKSNEEKEGQLKYNKNLQSKIVKYEELPEFITKEFSNFVGGLLPNFALSAIASVRNKTSNILGVFSKDVDPAFLGHYVSIPDCNDAISMLPKVFGTAITNLVDTCDLNFDSWINYWIDKNTNEWNRKIGKKTFNINADNLKALVNPSKKFEDKLNDVFKAGIDINNPSQIDFYKKEAANLFCSDETDNSNYKWAKLVQHSNLFSSPKNYKLTTGTIVKCKNDSNDDWRYLICIQQSCDALRIPKEGRTFLFLPLKKDIKGLAVVVEEESKESHFIVDDNSYAIEVYKFTPDEDKSLIIAQKSDSKECFFQDITGKHFVWVAELKEIFAQNIVTAYASQLSRVGVDNSEWLRLLGKKR